MREPVAALRATHGLSAPDAGRVLVPADASGRGVGKEEGTEDIFGVPAGFADWTHRYARDTFFDKAEAKA